MDREIASKHRRLQMFKITRVCQGEQSRQRDGEDVLILIFSLSSYITRESFNKMPLVEKWGREMATFPGNWLNSSLTEFTAMPSTNSAGAASLQASMRSLMV